MFLIDLILLTISFISLLLGFIVCSYKESKFYSFYRLHVLLFIIGFSFTLFPFICLNIFANKCYVCEKYVHSDYCTECGSYVVGDSLCSCGEVLIDGYSFCPSCGCEVDVFFD